MRAPTIVIVGAGREVVGFTQDDSAVDVEFSDDTSPNGYGMTSAVDQWCPLVNFFPTFAAVPLLLFAATNIGLQGSVVDEHAAAGHYGFMAALSFTVIGVGLLASLRPEGWRLTAWVAGILPALLGLVSLIYPVSSSLSLPWALAAMAWGVGFVVTAERARQAVGPVSLDAGPGRETAGDQRPSS